MVYDIVNVNGFIFLYSIDRILVYRYDNNQACGTIYFEEQLNQNNQQVEFGKFNPIVYNPRLYTGSLNFMAYNPNAEVLYVVKPSLEIDIINVNYNLNSGHNYSNNDVLSTYDPFNDTINITDLDEESFKPNNGINIIKFDANNNRLYWVFRAHDADTCPTGNFHYRKRFLGLYSVNTSGNLIYNWHEVERAKIDYRESNISDIAFNENSNSEYYYLLKINKIEVRKFSNPNFEEEIYITGNNYFQPPLSGGDALFKFSKFLYIKKPGIHLIVALPYRIPNSTPLLNGESDFFTINGDHNDSLIQTDINSYNVPSHRITDAAFLNGNNDLILSYAPDSNEVTNISGLGTDHDIAIFHYNNSSNSFMPYQALNTNLSGSSICPFDINASLKLTVSGNDELLISKKDELSKLTFNSTEYVPSQIIVKENGFFGKGVHFSEKSFISNPLQSGFEVIENINPLNPINIRTGYPAYHVTADNDGNKLYFFNKLNSYNNGLYICDINHGTGSETLNHFSTESCIGDCIYNKYGNQFLISENSDFGSNPAKIIIVENDINNTVADSILLPQGVQYPKEMFIAPNNRLYVMADMISGRTPKILIYTAGDSQNGSAYQFIDSFNVQPSPISDNFVYYSANFCYSPNNNKVYASLHPSDIVLNPYLSVPNSMFDLDIPVESGEGAVFSISDTGIIMIPNIDSYVGKIICPANMDSSQYSDKLFVIGKKLYEISSKSDSILQSFDIAFNDITYSTQHDQVFTLKDNLTNQNLTNRSAEIYKINCGEDTTTISQAIFYFPGQCGALFYNEYDQKVYLYHKFDEHKLGDTQSRLISFDADQSTNSFDSEDLGLKCFYPEYDHNGDFHYYFYNITTPYVNPYNNTIYVPNGGHSCVSKVEFEPTENLSLQDSGLTWLSFPRLDRDGSGNMAADTALDGRIEEALGGDDIGEMVGQDENNSDLLYINWDQSSLEWKEPQDDPLSHVNTKKGYILDLDYQNPPPKNNISLFGDLLAPDAKIDNIYTERENWLGYWLYQEQHPLDAISENDLDHIYFIQGQYWACAKMWSDGMSNPYWVSAVAKGKSVSIKYGDMVKVKTYQHINNFQWQNFGTTLIDIYDKAETENYTFNEQSGYTAIFIELDSMENLLEIGAFVDDSCVGATTVLPEDSLVMIPAYTEGISGEIYFESYYGSAKSFAAPITDYYVKDANSKSRKKRMIHTAEKQDYYLVSFKGSQESETELTQEQSWISCRPNPINSSATILLYNAEDAFIEIKLYNIYGKEMALIHAGMLNKGEHSFSFNGMDDNGRPLPNGTYILSMRSAISSAQTKVVILN